MSKIIEIKNVTHRYKGAKKESLKDVSLSVNEGEVILLCGESGSGKTSVVRLINGLVPHYYNGEMTGTVEVLGKDVSKTELYELAGIVGTVFQNPRSQFFSVDTDGEIVFGPENVGLEVDDIIKRKKQVTSEMNLYNLLGRSLFELSGGEKQKIACASVATLLPSVILLDEPSSNLDRKAINSLGAIIEKWKKQGKTIIISEHRLWYLMNLIDRVIYMKNGTIGGEWSGEEFAKFDDEKIKSLKLRSVIEEKNYADYFEGKLPDDMKEKSDGALSIKNEIRLKDFYFSYHKKPFLFKRKRFTRRDEDILQLSVPELSIPKGKVIGVIGKNGTGKSTFLRCVCGLESDCNGVIESEGVKYKGHSCLKYNYMVMQDVNHQLFTDSVEEEVFLSMSERDEEQCHKILDNLGLLEYRHTHPMALSGGQKQRVAIASAIASGAKMLLFDEPTSGLDYAHMKKVGRLLKELAESGRTVLVSTHDSELIEECCDHILVIKNGRCYGVSKSIN